MKLCPRHKTIIAALREAQRAAKKERDRLNRGVQPGKNKELSALHESMVYRRCVLMNINFGRGLCQACEYLKHCRTDVFANCLPSSMEERFARNEEAVSSNLAVGSKM